MSRAIPTDLLSPALWLLIGFSLATFSFAKPSIESTEGAASSPIDSITGESDPRMEILRIGYDIEVAAKMSRSQALYILGLVEESGAPISVDLLSEGAYLANLLLTDAFVSNDPLDSDRIFTRQRLVANRFSSEVVRLVAAHSSNDLLAENIVNVIDGGGLSSANGFVGELTRVLSDSTNSNVLNSRQFQDTGDLFGLTTDDFTAYAGKNVTVRGGSTVDISKWVGRDSEAPDATKVFTFAAGEDLKIEGDVTFTNNGYEAMDHALAVGAASDLEIAEGSTVKYDGSNFGLGAGKSIRIVKVSLETRDHLGLGTLDDLEVVDSTMKAGSGNRILLYAQNDMKVNGLTFSDGLGQVYMEASTLNLQNVDFPSGAEVRLVSELGGLDGRYPNFGSREMGRVNFISGVSYGGAANVMNDRKSFDLHGELISIESFDQ